MERPEHGFPAARRVLRPGALHLPWLFRAVSGNGAAKPGQGVAVLQRRPSGALVAGVLVFRLLARAPVVSRCYHPVGYALGYLVSCRLHLCRLDSCKYPPFSRLSLALLCRSIKGNC
jgi:hypothetical protein